MKSPYDIRISHETPRRLATLSLILFGGSLPLAAIANASTVKKNSACEGIEFSAPKGGPGLAEVEVFPITKNGLPAEDTISGKVIKGNDKGAIISNSTYPTDIGKAGEFVLTWNESSHKIQEATVSLSVEVSGHSQLQECPDTTLHLNPGNLHVSPALQKP
jgi:hypothetical protein